MQKVNLSEKLALFNDRRRPKIVGELNGQPPNAPQQRSRPRSPSLPRSGEKQRAGE